MTFNPNIPKSGDKLSSSQVALLSNNQALDNTFGIDHYKFSDATGDVGKHKTVTTPKITIPTTTTDPKLYGHEVTTNVGTLQFSRGESNANPTPLTQKSGVIAALPALTNINLLDFTGVTTCNFRVSSYIGGTATSAMYAGSVTSGVLNPTLKMSPPSPASISFPISGNILQIRSLSNLSDVFWVIEFLRIE